MESEIPVTNADHSENRPINAAENAGTDGYGFEVTEDLRAEIAADQNKRKEKMKRERLAKKGIISGSTHDTAPVIPSGGTVGAAPGVNHNKRPVIDPPQGLAQSRGEHFGVNT